MAGSGFEEVYAAWLEGHKRMRTGERLRRLEEGHGYLEKAILEKLWWPAFGSLDGLHPEYEVFDYKDGRRFLDIAIRPESSRVVLEGDGFNAHVRDIDRWDYADNHLRDLHLIADGWTVLHFSYDVIHHRTRQAQQLLQQIILGRDASAAVQPKLSLIARETLRMVKRAGGTARFADIGMWIGKSPGTTRKVLRELAAMKLIRPANPGNKLVWSYELTKLGRDMFV